MRVAFRVDGSQRIGGGHVIRCLTLADELARRGHEAVFVCAQLPEELGRRVREQGHGLVVLPASSDVSPADGDWDLRIGEPGVQRENAQCTLAALDGRADWIVVDHYGLDRSWEQSVRSAGPRILVIDDLANRPHDCDMLLDQTFGRSAGDYRALVPEGCRILAGSLYALLRPEFAAARPEALARRAVPRPVERLLISLGSTDVGGVTARTLEEVVEAGVDCPIDVVLGSAAPSLDRTEQVAREHGQITIHADTAGMASLLTQADLAIGAAGTSSWERCCVGLPAVMLVLANNQQMIAGELERAGAGRVVPAGGRQFREALSDLMDDARARLLMTASAAPIADGLGAGRVMEHLLGTTRPPAGPIAVREANEADALDGWLWRNDPRTRATSINQDPIAWPDHLEWWRRAITSPDRRLLIAETEGRPVSVLRFDRTADGEVVSINLRPDARGLGLGRPVLAAGVCWMEERGARRFEAQIHGCNVASRRIFESVGFTATAALAANGFRRYLLERD